MLYSTGHPDTLLISSMNRQSQEKTRHPSNQNSQHAQWHGRRQSGSVTFWSGCFRGNKGDSDLISVSFPRFVKPVSSLTSNLGSKRKAPGQSTAVPLKCPNESVNMSFCFSLKHKQKRPFFTKNHEIYIYTHTKYMRPKMDACIRYGTCDYVGAPHGDAPDTVRDE